MVWLVVGQLPRGKLPPTLILTLTQTLTLTGSNFPMGKVSGHRFGLLVKETLYQLMNEINK